MRDLTSDQRYRLLANHAVEHAMIVLDEAGTILEWSRGAERLLGWNAGEAVGQPAAMLFTPEDRANGVPAAELGTARVLGRCSDVRWHLCKDGSTVFCDGIVNKLVDDDGALLGFGKVMREAYALPRHGQRPGGAEQRSFLAAVLESVENGIVACDRDGKLTFFNEAARAIHGLPEIPLTFDKWAAHYRLFNPDGVTPLALEQIPLYRALRGEQVDSAQLVVHAADGVRREVHVTGRALEDNAGQIMGAVISMNDVSSAYEAVSARRDATREQDKRIAAELAEEQMRKTQTQLRLATESARLGIFSWDVARDAGTWENPRMYEIFGVEPGAPLINAATLMRDYLHPDDAERFRQATMDTLHDGARFHFTGRFYRPPQRALRWIELSGSLEPDRGNAPVIVGTAADITEHKEAEEALASARIRIEATLSAGEVASWIWDIRNDRLLADRNLSRLFGVPEELAADAPLETYTAAIHPDDLDEVSRLIQLAIDTGEPYRATYRVGKSSGYRWINARGRVEYDEHGQPALLAGVTFDITRQKETQDLLHSTEERYRTLIGSIDEAFGIVRVLLDADGKPYDYRFEEVNPAMQKQSGLVDAAGKTIREMVPDIEGHWIEIYGRVALTRQPARFVEHSAAMGYWWDVYATPIGEPEELRIAILFTDITARKQAEENLRQVAADLSEANRRKTEFLATLAHELRNPLAPLRTGLDLLRMAGNGAGTGIGNHAGAGARVQDMMDRQLKQMVHLIDDLMNVSRINSGKIVLQKETLDLKEAVANAVEATLPAVEAAHHRLSVDLPPQPLRLFADPTRLAQILGNVLANAVKYTPPGGQIGVTASIEADMVRIEVADSGIGIPLEEQAHVFEMFSQVSRNMGRAGGGLGIGLSLVRSLAEMHGGSVAVRSAGAGLGTTFTLRLPLAEGGTEPAAGADAGAALPDATPAVQGGLRIVVADDNVDAANILTAVLQAGGHAAEPVHDGLQALRRIVALRPDLAILDIGMPGLNGYEVARKVRAIPGTGNMVLVALTGWGGELDRERSKEAGFDAHLTKPAAMDDLERLLQLAASRAAHPR